MHRFAPRRPSAAMVVAVIALVMAMAGAAVAGTGVHSKKVTTKKVKKIADQEISKAAPTLNVASADSAKIANNVYSANVLATGTLLGSIPSGATSSHQGGANSGQYHVSFGRPITGCTISGGAANNTAPVIALVAVGVADANTINVFTRTGGNVPNDEPFYVQMICPAG